METLGVADGGVAARPADHINCLQAFSVTHVAFTARDGFTGRDLQPPPPHTAGEVALGATTARAALLVDLEMHATPSSMLLCARL